jgi:2-C-methyl-D-erythritol 4-phosphate cytidylyltransferase
LPDKILEINGSTEPAVTAGMDVAMIPGDEGNFKITTEADLVRFRQIVSDRSKG